MPKSTKLTRRLALRHPVILAPMAGVAGGRLAGAVSAAGGLGLIGGGYGDAAWLEREFAAAGNHRVGCGLITWSLMERPALLDLVLAHRPAAVMLSFGDPAPFAARIKAAEAALICQVQTLAHARTAIDAGADVIVAQGAEAGGHGATRGTLALVPAVADLLAAMAPDVPLVAAGGIADGRGLAAALTLGADGVLVGTRFYAAEESLGHATAKAHILRASGDETVRTSVFDVARNLEWPQSFTMRTLRNDFTKRWHGDTDSLRAMQAAEAARYAAAAAAGNFDTAAVIAGEAIDLIHDLPPAAVLVERLVAEAESALHRHR